MNRWKWVGSRLARRLWPLDSEDLCQEAQRRTGLEDFGPPPLEPGLSLLLQSLREEADLHTLGTLLIRIHLRDLLETRLQLARKWNEGMGTLEAVPIEKPLVILGMPRSGSTFLHELLAADPTHRAPLVWEVMFPVPGAAANRCDTSRRIRQAERCLWWFRRLAPRADAVYPMRAQTPHECVAIHSHTFLSEEFLSTCRIPTYEKFLRSADLTPAYAWQKRFLQHLQLGTPPLRWVLKSPDHAYGLEPLLTVFPDAMLIQTHRNPLEVLASSADLTQVLRGLFAQADDLSNTLAAEARTLVDNTERFIRFRDRHPELAGRIVDIQYRELVTDPLATVRRIYAQLGIALTEPAAESMRQLAHARSKYRGPRASASAHRLNRTSAEEWGAFERYCLRFGIPFPQ